MGERQNRPAIEMIDVVKTFGSTRALDGLDLRVERGEVHGFVGPNGSGKSVTIRTLLGLLRSEEGQVTVLGRDPWADAVDLHRRMAYVPGDVSFWSNLSGGEIIDYFARLRGDSDPTKRTELLRRFELDPTKKAGTYSKGNRQKVALVVALASGAELLLLDEPTSGLDPLMEVVFQEAIAELASEGRTVLLSSHVLSEVEKLCERVTIIRRGRRVQTGTLDELRTTTRTSMAVTTSQPSTGLETMTGVHAVRGTSMALQFEVENDHLAAVMRHLASFGIENLESRPPTLEELFVREYGDDETTEGRDEP